MPLEQLKAFAAMLKSKGLRSDYIINEIKEYLQVRALNFIYNEKKYNQKLIFTGGTCLRFCFGLPRLSEDLDFDYKDKISISGLKEEITDYFKKVFKYSGITSALKGKNDKIYIKFPLLKELGLSYKGSEVLYLKIEPTPAPPAPCKIEVPSINRDGFYFYIKRYSLPDLMSGKINAFLTRVYYQGKANEIDFKGRDIFDLIWYMGRGMQPNFKRLSKLLSKTEYKNYNWADILEHIGDKIRKVRKQHLAADIQHFIEKKEVCEQFIDNYLAVLEQYQATQKGRE
ncbi:MAG: nucleotidyl transferase AbiEii/AbiGii toxin family protein [Candidatus Margulisbacteria bacterium]|nr:nucleotidyl transferase AbiEii/AbiGii toxin family protein [Candidatus Margulisiibacteriota bacterium]